LQFVLRTFAQLRTHITALQGRFRLTENTFMAILAVAIGLLAGLGNYAFRRLIDLVRGLTIDPGMTAFGIDLEQWTLSRLLLVLFPMLGGVLILLLGLLVGKDLKYSFPQFLAQVNLRGGKISTRKAFIRGGASAITLGTGGSAGPEGPIAQIGGAIGGLFGQSFKMSGERLKTLVACGVSGGVAATFNAPIAGVFFAHEIVLLSSFERASFTSIVIASGMSTVVSRALLGNSPAFAVPPYVLHSSVELFFYLGLGAIIGVLAASFIAFHYRVGDYLSALRFPPLAKPVLGGALVGLIGVVFPQVFGDGYHFMEQVLHGQGWWLLLAALVLFKALATSITLGSGLPGGLFAPSLFIGAMTGGAFGKLMQLLFPAMQISPGAYALVGMGAFLSAATHAPMTAIFLLFEMTASYEVIVPIMMTCAIGTSISRHYKKESLETEELARAGINLEAGKERNIMKSLLVGDVMTRDPEAVPENMTLRQFTQYIVNTKHANFPLVNRQGEVTGMLSVQDFMGVVFEKDLMDLVVVKELATLKVLTIFEDDNLDYAMQKIGHRNIEQLPVVDKETGRKLIGLISRRDMVSAYNRALMARSLETE
jgi:chloride channel protein, CIC family